MANWPANAVPADRRNTMWVQGYYDTGEVRDGHKIVRHECEEDGIDVIHPPECNVPERDLGSIIVMQNYDCPWAAALEGQTVAEMYEGDDLEHDLPVGEEVEIVWQYSGGRSWTDYGWEGDSAFSWRAPAFREEKAAAGRRYACGVDAEAEVTCDRCPDPDGCIDASYGTSETDQPKGT